MSFVQGLEIMASLVFCIYLIWISWQDYIEMKVVRYSHLLGIAAIFLLVILEKRKVCFSVKEFIFAGFVLLFLQIIAYYFKLYGFADVIVLFLCGLFFLVRKGTEQYLLAYFIVQAISGTLLFGVQIFKKNVHGLKLQHPVPYIPYISVAFILTNMVL